MRQPSNTKQSFSPSDKTRILFVALFLAVLLVVLGILLGLVLKHNGFRLPVSALPAQTTPTTAPIMAVSTEVIPTISVPTPDCGAPTLVIGATTFQIQPIQFSPDGALPIPTDGVGIAFWLDGADGNQLIALSPTPENISLESTIMAETTAKITLADCSSKTFSLSALEQNFINVSMLSNQLTSGLTIFFQTDTAGNGLIVRGELSEMIFPQ